MKHQWITADHVFDGKQMSDARSLRIEGGQIVDARAGPESGRTVAGCITPGFIDLQVNGGGGVQLNVEPTANSMIAIAAAHKAFGTVAVLPTVITDHPSVLGRAAEAALATKGQPGIIGLHIEGPHISKARRGTHAEAHVRPCDDKTLAIVAKLRADDIPVMITVAPEAITLDQIAQLSKTGAVVSIGHTDAPAEQIEAAIAAGACCGTHLFNAMSPMTSRAPGAVGAILNAGIGFGIICDGHHVDDRMVKLALRATAGTDAAFLVSDAMATVGGPEQFDLYGQTVRLRNGKLINAEGSLAGAHVTQAVGVGRLIEHIGLSMETALRMAITTPAHIIGRPDLSDLMGRSIDDIIVYSPRGPEERMMTLRDVLAEHPVDAAE